jgi:hypothetical protein
MRTLLATIVLAFARLSHDLRRTRRSKRPATFFRICCLSGAPGRIRTCGLWLRRPTLYPAELRAPEGVFQLYVLAWCEGVELRNR